jgi:hypothetical protein
MTTAHDNVLLPAPPPRSGDRRRSLLLRLGAGLAVLAVAAAGGWLAYALNYQPIRPGGLVGGRPPVQRATDGINDTGFLVPGATGARGVIEYSVANSGSHSIRVLGLDTSEIASPMSMRWAPELTNGGVTGGTPAQVRPLPATVPPGAQITLWLTVTKPSCAGGGSEVVTQLPIRWSALGIHHVYRLALAPEATGNGMLPIYVCFPSSALRHAERG